MNERWSRSKSALRSSGGLLAATLSLTGCASPSGAPWTILCLERQGPDRLRFAEEVAASLRRTDGIRPADVFVADGSDHVARVYYGRFRRPLDPESGRFGTPRAMQSDLETIKQLGTAEGRPAFLGARAIRVPQPNVGLPEWDLRRLDARYSLQVAVFEPRGAFWEFKRAAAEYCAYLRGLGYDAFYYHTEASSIVGVGAFGADAVVTRSDGRTYYAAAVEALQSDELLKHNLLNGAVYSVLAEDGERVPVPSRLVEIPRPDPIR